MTPPPTRRRFLKRTGALAAAGVLAGCSTLSRLQDGAGPRWESVDPPGDGGAIHHLEFTDEGVGWLALGSSGVGNDGGFYRTDGGGNWTKRRSEDARVVTVALDGDRVYGFGSAGGSEFFSWYSDDGGENWSPIANEAYAYGESFGDAAFFTDEVGFATSDTGRHVQATTDGAESFEELDLEDCSINDLEAIGDRAWIAGHGNPDAPNEGGCLLATDARGAAGSWTLERFTDEAHDRAGGALDGVYTPDGEEIWVAGRNRQVYHTTDGGDNWTQIEGFDERISTFVGIGGHGDHVVLSGLDQGGASGQGGLLVETTDGGDTWEITWEPENGGKESFDDVVFVEEDLAYVYGTFGTIRKYDG